MKKLILGIMCCVFASIYAMEDDLCDFQDVSQQKPEKEDVVRVKEGITKNFEWYRICKLAHSHGLVTFHLGYGKNKKNFF